MSPWRSFLIFSLFFIDVRVRAEEAAAAGCWGRQIPCAIHSENARRELRADGLTLIMARQSLLEQRDERNIQFVNGEFYLETNKTLKFKTPYATFWCLGVCKALVRRKQNEVNLKSLEGEWLVQRLGDTKDYRLASGLQVTASEVQGSGLAHMEFPQSLPWTATVNAWAKLFVGPTELFKSELVRFRAEWKAAVESASVVHAQFTERAIASHQADLAQERARRKAIEKENQALRSLFRQKNFIDP